eukprot:sb/3472699/
MRRRIDRQAKPLLGRRGSTRKVVSCLNDEEECNLVLEPCSTQVRESRAGIQVRTRDEVRAARKDTPAEYSRVKLGPTGTRFFNRSMYSGLMIGDYLRIMEERDGEVELRSLPNPDKPSRQKQKEVLHRMKTNKEVRWREICVVVASVCTVLGVLISLRLGVE